MRYLLIDTSKIEPLSSESYWIEELKNSGYKPILSEEETLAKFKEVYDEGYKNAEYQFSEFTDLKQINVKWWEDVKEEL